MKPEFQYFEGPDADKKMKVFELLDGIATAFVMATLLSGFPAVDELVLEAAKSTTDSILNENVRTKLVAVLDEV